MTSWSPHCPAHGGEPCAIERDPHVRPGAGSQERRQRHPLERRRAAPSPVRAALRPVHRPARTRRSSPTTVALTYRELDNLANQVARHLIDRGITSGDRVGLLFDKTVEIYVALLAVLKVNAAYVPLDPGFPTERMRFILGDAGVKAIVSMSAFRGRLAEFDVASILLEPPKREISAKPRPASATPRRRRRSISSATSSTRRERPATPRASSSSTRASAISSGSPPSSTASGPATASTRA